MHRKSFFITLGALAILLVLFLMIRVRTKLAPTVVQTNNNTPATNAPATPTVPPPAPKPAQEIVARDLKIPWEIVFLPDNSMLVTERPGTLRHITTNKISIPVQGVAHVGEGGLLGLALHPQFKDNQYIYLYLTTRSDNKLVNRVERYKFNNNALSERQVIMEGILGDSNHDGGRIAFGPDGNLYIAVGDAELPNLSQDTNSLNGKILRIRDDGTIPSDNPFNNAVYSYGHRNAQGLAWDNQGRLWATEHGPSGSGAAAGQDELNLIEKGKNYGWPVVTGDQKRDGMVAPMLHSGISDTWAPAGLTFSNGQLYFTGLRGASVYVATIKADNSVDLKSYFKGQYGRLRAAAMGPDGFLYISTSNRDGRGSIKVGDDKIIRINTEALK